MDFHPKKPVLSPKLSLILHYHPHTLASLIAVFCIEIGKAIHPEANVSFTLVEAQLDGRGRPVRVDLGLGSNGVIPLLVRPSPETCISSSIDIAGYLAHQTYWKLIPPDHKNEIEGLLRQRHIFEEDIILLSYAKTPFERHPFVCDVVTHLRRVTYRNSYEYRVMLPERLKLLADEKSAYTGLYHAERRIHWWLSSVYLLWCRYRHDKRHVWLLRHHGTARKMLSALCPNWKKIYERRKGLFMRAFPKSRDARFDKKVFKFEDPASSSTFKLGVGPQGPFYSSLLQCRPQRNADHFSLVDAHAAALIHRLVELSRVDLIPADLLSWATTMFKLPVWQQISKGAGTMGWVGRGLGLESSPIPDPNKDSPFGTIGSGRGTRGRKQVKFLL